jgi:hypothetical protein
VTRLDAKVLIFGVVIPAEDSDTAMRYIKGLNRGESINLPEHGLTIPKKDVVTKGFALGMSLPCAAAIYRLRNRSWFRRL